MGNGVEVKIKLYEINGERVLYREDKQIAMRSHWSYNQNKVVLVLKDTTVTVSAQDLIDAVRSCTQ